MLFCYGLDNEAIAESQSQQKKIEKKSNCIGIFRIFAASI